MRPAGRLWRTKLKNNLKAIHNFQPQIEVTGGVVANQVKEQFESNSQLHNPHHYAGDCCGEPS